jgi:integrase
MPRTGENIYKRKDGRWEARFISAYKEDGSPQYRSLYAKSYADVKSKQTAALAHSLAAEPTGLNTNALFSDVANSWLGCIRLSVKESTLGKYERIVRLHILPTLGKCRLKVISQEKVEKLTGGLIAKSLSSKTTRDILMVLKQILKHVNAANHIDFRRIAPKIKPKEMRVLSKTEQETLCEYLAENADSVKLGVLLSLYTGIRIGELCALRWENIDLTANTLRVKSTMQRVPNLDGVGRKTKLVVTPPKSECSLRTIPLPDFLVALLKSITKRPQAYLLTGEKSRWMEPRTLQYRFKTILKGSHLADANFHALRHTFATRCIEIGFDVKSLSEILGHASVDITLNRYVHSSFELKREHMGKLSL